MLPNGNKNYFTTKIRPKQTFGENVLKRFLPTMKYKKIYVFFFQPLLCLGINWPAYNSVWLHLNSYTFILCCFIDTYVNTRRVRRSHHTALLRLSIATSKN